MSGANYWVFSNGIEVISATISGEMKSGSANIGGAPSGTATTNIAPSGSGIPIVAFYVFGGVTPAFTIDQNGAISGATITGATITGATNFTTDLQLASGSAAAPSLTFSSDTTTGLYLESAVGSPAASGIGFVVGGVTVASIQDNGVLIGNHLNAASADFTGLATISASTSVTINFGSNYTGTNAPLVVVTPTTNPTTAGVYWVVVNGGSGAWTGFTLNVANTATISFSYIVIG